MLRSRREIVWYVALAVIVAWCCTVVYLHALGDLIDGIPAWHQGFLDNLAFAPSQYRWWGFAVPEGLIRLGVGPVDAYIGLRFAYLAAALFVVALIARAMGLDRAGASFLVVAVGVYYASATQAQYQPAEEPNLLVFALMVLFVLTRTRFVWFVPVFVVGVLTKSTIGFVLPFIALAFWYDSDKPRRTVVGEVVLLSVIFVTGYVGLRLHFGTDRPYLGGLWQIDDNVRALRDVPEEATLWLLPSLVPLWFVARRWSSMPIVVRCFVPTLVLFVLGHLAISRLLEWRTYTPLVLVMWPAVLLEVFGSADQSAGQSADRSAGVVGGSGLLVDDAVGEDAVQRSRGRLDGVDGSSDLLG